MFSDQVRAALVSGRRSFNGSAAFILRHPPFEKLYCYYLIKSDIGVCGGKMKPKSIRSIAIFVAVVSFAALSRYLLTEIETRLQILVFLILAVCVEWIVKPLLGVRSQWLLAILTGLCSTIAIILVRWYLEGLCPHTWPQCPNPIYAIRKSWGI